LAQDLDTCLDALRSYDRVWSSNGKDKPPTNIHGNKAGVSLFDAAGWAVDFWSYGVPAEYVCALNRAFGEVGATKELGQTFKKCLESYSDE
jgi:hypothetical protein